VFVDRVGHDGDGPGTFDLLGFEVTLPITFITLVIFEAWRSLCGAGSGLAGTADFRLRVMER
jgi:hypothetical protein